MTEHLSVFEDGSGGRRRRRPPRRWGRILLVLGGLSLPFLVAIGWFWYQVDPPGGPGRVVDVRIPNGVGVGTIADRLEARGVVGSALAFRLYARLSGSDTFQAGSYRLHRDLGASAAVDALERGPRRTYRKLALPPGLRFDEVARRIGALPGLSAARVLALASGGAVRSAFEPGDVNSLEGLTWPDTYYVERHEDERKVLETIVGAFDDHARALGLAGGTDPYRTVIVASLIQREAGVDEDRPLIAAVIENRLRDGMPLQIDASVVYARGGGSQPLTDADFALPSPYNTYVVAGLPPTPISTVTAASLAAALHPAPVPYLYYVLTDASGKHAFSETYAQHEANIADAQRRGVIP